MNAPASPSFAGGASDVARERHIHFEQNLLQVPRNEGGHDHGEQDEDDRKEAF